MHMFWLTFVELANIDAVVIVRLLLCVHVRVYHLEEILCTFRMYVGRDAISSAGANQLSCDDEYLNIYIYMNSSLAVARV